MAMIYRFKQPILLSNGKWLGNRFKEHGPLGGEAFFDKEEDNEIQNAIREQVAKEAGEVEKPKRKKEQ